VKKSGGVSNADRTYQESARFWWQLRRSILAVDRALRDPAYRLAVKKYRREPEYISCGPDLMIWRLPPDPPIWKYR